MWDQQDETKRPGFFFSMSMTCQCHVLSWHCHVIVMSITWDWHGKTIWHVIVMFLTWQSHVKNIHDMSISCHYHVITMLLPLQINWRQTYQCHVNTMSKPCHYRVITVLKKSFGCLCFCFYWWLFFNSQSRGTHQKQNPYGIEF